MKFLDSIKRDAMIMEAEKQRKENIEFDKKLYNSNIIQQLIERVNELEERVCELERR